MTTYNTGNPIGSTAVKDLFDNTENFDTALNDVVSDSWIDRLGKERKTWNGMERLFGFFMNSSEEAFQQFLLSSGYEDVGDYAAGLLISRRNQVFRKDGELYRATASLDLPYVTTGDWNDESDKFISVGDAALRQELGNASGNGASLVGWIQSGVGAVYRAVLDKVRGRVEVKDFGAIGDGTYHPLSERFATLEAAQAQYPHVTSLSQSIDWAALMAAMRTGKTVEDDGLHLIVTDVWYPTKAGQQFRGAGEGITIIENSVNDAPLFCFGNPTDPNGAAPWSSISDLTLRGRANGATIWGVFCPNAPRLEGSIYAPGQVEGMSNDPSNVYYGRLPFTPSEWNTAARGCSISNVMIYNIYGGHALHVSAWAFSGSNAKLWSGQNGLRNSGSANSNSFVDLYISTMSQEGILHPNTDFSIPTATSYRNCIVQQCGVDSTGRGAIALLKGQGTQFDTLYLERNNERGSPADIFVSSSEIGLRINSLRHRTNNEIVLPVIVRTEGSGTYIGSVVYGTNVSKVVWITGTDTRTETRIEGPIRPVGSNTAIDGVVVDDTTNKRTSSFLPEVDGMSGIWLDGWTRFYKGSGKRAIRQSVSTSTELAFESHGDVRLVVDAGNGTTGGFFYLDHNGVGGSGTNLWALQCSNGNLFPGTDGAHAVGRASNRVSTYYGVTGTINTSDRREKEQIGDIPDAWLDAWAEVPYVRFKWIERVAAKGDAARFHVGVVSQDFEAALLRHGIDPADVAAWCHDVWVDEYRHVYETVEIQNEDGSFSEVERPTEEKILVTAAGDRFGVRPDQCFFLNGALERRERSRLEDRLRLVEGRLAALEGKATP